jgi:hypothetical protein
MNDQIASLVRLRAHCAQLDQERRRLNERFALLTDRVETLRRTVSELTSDSVVTVDSVSTVFQASAVRLHRRADN